MRLLALRDLRLVWLAAVVSWSGDALSFLAFMWLAYDVGGATGVIIVRLADSIPSVVVGLLAGVVADRVERRRLMVGADLFRAAVLVLLVSVAAAGQPTVFALALTMFLIRIGDAFFEPAAGAILPDLVEGSMLQRANALFQATSDALSALGMGAAGILLAVLPLVHFFTLDLLSFVASAALLSFVATKSVAHRTEHERAAGRADRRRPRAGLPSGAGHRHADVRPGDHDRGRHVHPGGALAGQLHACTTGRDRSAS